MFLQPLCFILNFVINTLNESHLHRTLKRFYAEQIEGSQTEIKVGKYICDIVCPGKEIIEIQTTSLGHLLTKIMFFIQQKYKIKVVYPLPVIKYIETKDLSANKISKRKSPLSKTIYKGLFRELTALYPILLNKNFTLEVIEISYTEERIKESQLKQSQNNLRRFKKNWNKTGKRLESIGQSHVFHRKKSYIKLLPQDLPENFTAKEIYSLLKKQGIKTDMQNVRLLCWLFSHMELFKISGKKEKAYMYKIT